MLSDLDAQNWEVLFGAPINSHRASIGLSLVHDVRRFMFTDHPWLAADPTLGPGAADPAVMRTSAWILPDERSLRPSWWRSWTPAHRRCTWASAVCALCRTAPGPPSRQSARRAAVRSSPTGWADLALIDDGDDCFAVGEVNQQTLFGRMAAVVQHGGAGTTTTGCSGGHSPGGGAPGGGPVVLGRPGGRPGHRRDTRRSDSDHRVPVSSAQDGPDPRDPRTSDRRGRHDPHRRGPGLPKVTRGAK
jgi:hypothetical protein